MSRVPKDIIERLAYFHREVEGLFRRLFEEELVPGPLMEEAPYPPVDVVETEDEIQIRADLAGADKDAIELHGAPNFLIIRGCRRVPQEKLTYVRIERTFGPFQRLVVLPSPGDTSQVRARYDRGVLEVRMPKVADRRKVHRKIPIE